MIDHEEFRYGSAGWQDKQGVRRAGLLGKDGTPVGFLDDDMLRLSGDAPHIVFGGAGTGKLRDDLGYELCLNGDENRVVLDLRGEEAAISLWTLIRFDANGWCLNPYGLLGLPQHRINILEVLEAHSPSLHADATLIAEALITSTGGENGQYFEQRARQYLVEILKYATIRFKRPDVGLIYNIVGSIEGDSSTWAEHLEHMLGCSVDSVRRTANEMLIKQQDTPKEFGGIMGTIYGAFAPLDDPALLASLSNANFSFRELVCGQRPGTLYLNIPAEYVASLAPILRTIFTVAMIVKGRAPDAPRLNLIVDEAGQLGRFSALKRAVTFGRGQGVKARIYFQDPGQVQLNFGYEGFQSFMNSCQLRKFMPPRDIETAQLISRMLGQETLSYDDPVAQGVARQRSRQAAMDFLFGDDPFRSAMERKHYRETSEIRTKQPRYLMTPDELLRMPDDQCILFISGLNLRPILAHKYAYYTRREMAGLYLNNPYHPPQDAVRIQTRRGAGMARIVTERVTPSLAHYPQYEGGYVRYVDGYRPF